MFAAQRRGAAETFGDFAARVGFDALRAFQATYVSPAAAAALPKVRARPLLGRLRPCCACAAPRCAALRPAALCAFA